MADSTTHRRRVRFSLKWLLVLPAIVAAFVVGWKQRVAEQQDDYRSSLVQAEELRESLVQFIVRGRRPSMREQRVRMEQLQMIIDRAEHNKRMKQFQEHPLNR